MNRPISNLAHYFLSEIAKIEKIFEEYSVNIKITTALHTDCWCSCFSFANTYILQIHRNTDDYAKNDDQKEPLSQIMDKDADREVRVDGCDAITIQTPHDRKIKLIIRRTEFDVDTTEIVKKTEDIPMREILFTSSMNFCILNCLNWFSKKFIASQKIVAIV
ncbi:MAG: hypothetical protein AAGI90_04065 [Chlamydiota bacterium]